MVGNMIRKNWYILALLFLYLLFLSKDHLWGFVDNREELNQFLYDEKLEYYQNEYEEMKKILNLSYSESNIIYGKVLMRDIYQFYQEITISAGSSSGVHKNDLVVNEEGVIGVVQEVYQNTRIVTLLTNPDFELSVKVNGAYGILTSHDDEVFVKNIKLDEKIEVGDAIYTSGLTSTPGDILIGKVKSVWKDDLELQYLIQVEVASDLKNLNFVAVLGGKET